MGDQKIQTRTEKSQSRTVVGFLTQCKKKKKRIIMKQYCNATYCDEKMCSQKKDLKSQNQGTCGSWLLVRGCHVGR